MIDLLAALFIGILIGIVTGLLPGLHPNAVLFLLLPAYFLWEPPAMQFIAFATGVSVVHTFVSFIPSVLLGAPDADTALSVLPGHQYVHRGRGLEAIELTVYGGLIATTLALFMLPLLFFVVPPLYNTVQPHMHLLLAGALLFLVAREKKKAATLGTVLLSGMLGLIALQSPAANTQYILLPLFSGLFGLSTILTSLYTGSVLPPQQRHQPVDSRMGMKGGWYGFGAGLLAGFLPGIGSSQSAFLIDELADMTTRDFVVALGGITTADLFLSILALHVIGNPRSGAAVAIQQVSRSITLYEILLVIGMAMIATGIGALLTQRLGRHAVTVVDRVPYRLLLYAVTLFIVIGTYILTGSFGLLVLGTATALGVLAVANNVRRSYCMAVLIVPTILYYAGITVPLF